MSNGFHWTFAAHNYACDLQACEIRGCPAGSCPGAHCVLLHMLLWLLGTWATVSQEPQRQWAQSPGQSAAFSLTSSPPSVKGLLRKASFEMRIQVDREGQEPRYTCSMIDKSLALSAVDASLLVLWLSLRTGVQRMVCVGFPGGGGPPCRWQAQACLNCHTHAKLRLTFRSLVVRGSLVRFD